MKADQLTSIFHTTEQAIRHLLSGFVVTAVSLLSIANPKPIFVFGTENPIIALTGIGVVGFLVYSIYRIASWAIIDCIAFYLGLSAPAVERPKKPGKKGSPDFVKRVREWLAFLSYSDPYALFLLWRYESNSGEKIDGYLSYRWAVAHFAMITAISLLISKCRHSPESLIDPYSRAAFWIGLIVLAIALWQIAFLFRVERSLYKRSKEGLIKGSTPSHSDSSDLA